VLGAARARVWRLAAAWPLVADAEPARAGLQAAGAELAREPVWPPAADVGLEQEPVVPVAADVALAQEQDELLAADAVRAQAARPLGTVVLVQAGALRETCALPVAVVVSAPEPERDGFPAIARLAEAVAVVVAWVGNSPAARVPVVPEYSADSLRRARERLALHSHSDVRRAVDVLLAAGAVRLVWALPPQAEWSVEWLG
jgi:hypothetical protein